MKQWWQQLQMRERWIVGIGVICLIFALGYRLGWVNYQQLREQQQGLLARQQQTLRWLKTHSPVLNQSSSSITALPFAQAANQAADTLQITIMRIHQAHDYQLTLAPLSFNRLLRYLQVMQHQYGYRAIDVSVQASDSPGMVRVNNLRFDKR